jgi:hypothetical protein
MKYFKYYHKLKNLFIYFEYRLIHYFKNINKSWIYEKLYSYILGVSIAKKINQTIHLEYLFEGRKYEIYLPLDNRLKSKMINLELYIDNKKINHQLGVPFLVTPDQMGVRQIKIQNFDEEKIFEGKQPIKI